MNDKHLHETLEKLGVDNLDISPSKVLGSSPPEKVENARVYALCNQIMLDELRGENLGPIYHVTGEMRAVSDPLHREVCRMAWKQHGTPVVMMAHIPPERRKTGRDVWKWNTENWPPQLWSNHLDVFHLFASGATALYMLPKAENMHFSLFGSKYVLLQEEHDHDAHVKRVWLLESERLRDALLPRVERCFKRTTELTSRLFHNFVGMLSDSLHLEILHEFHRPEGASPELFDEQCSLFGTSFDEVIGNLAAVGFLRVTHGRTEITNDGREFFSLFVKA